jgi:hypothetical protein
MAGNDPPGPFSGILIFCALRLIVNKVKNNTLQIIRKPLHSISPIIFKFRLDFCGLGRIFFDQPESLNNHGPSPKFTAKVTAETVAAANSADEIAAGAYG